MDYIKFNILYSNSKKNDMIFYIKENELKMKKISCIVCVFAILFLLGCNSNSDSNDTTDTTTGFDYNESYSVNDPIAEYDTYDKNSLEGFSISTKKYEYKGKNIVIAKVENHRRAKCSDKRIRQRLKTYSARDCSGLC